MCTQDVLSFILGIARNLERDQLLPGVQNNSLHPVSWHIFVFRTEYARAFV
jgi:hypothetical protein